MNTQYKELTVEAVEEEIGTLDYDLEVYQAAQQCEVELYNVIDCYAGEWSSNEEFVQQMLEDCGTIPEDLPSYIHIDWKHTAHEIMFDYFESNGHYFRNC